MPTSAAMTTRDLRRAAERLPRVQLGYLGTRLVTPLLVLAFTQAHLERYPLAKPNYNQAKRQKENARKARQQEKLAKKLARVAGEPEVEEAAADAAPAPTIEPSPKVAP